MKNKLAVFSARLVFGGIAMGTLAFAAPAAAQRDPRDQPGALEQRDLRGRCDSCGTVVTTNRKDEKGSGTAGTVVGGVGGAVAGNVIGHNTTSTIIGGVGGAVAGNVIGKKLTRKKLWSVQVRMDRGGTRDVDYDADPGFHQGDRVRLAGGRLQRI